MSAAVLSVDGVETYYGRIQALHGISIEVGEGEIVALIGGNGAGKTTTLRTISGLLRPARGSITFRGTDLTSVTPDGIVRLGVIHSPEGRRIFPRMTVQENLELGAFARSDAGGIRKDLDDVLALFPRLKERLVQRGGTLSGGEQQMLAIARALMARPKLLLLDEPSMGLAPRLVGKIFEIVRDIAARGMTILLVEQNARLALEAARRGYVMESGAVVLSGDAGKLRADPRVREAYLGEAA